MIGRPSWTTAVRVAACASYPGWARWSAGSAAGSGPRFRPPWAIRRRLVRPRAAGRRTWPKRWRRRSAGCSASRPPSRGDDGWFRGRGGRTRRWARDFQADLRPVRRSLSSKRAGISIQSAHATGDAVGAYRVVLACELVAAIRAVRTHGRVPVSGEPRPPRDIAGAVVDRRRQTRRRTPTSPRRRAYSGYASMCRRLLTLVQRLLGPFSWHIGLRVQEPGLASPVRWSSLPGADIDVPGA
jgi:hypothetical protein